MMKKIHHPDIFKQGTRVLFLKGRYKDGLSVQRSVSRITHTPEDFNEALTELCRLANEGERVYGSVDARNIRAAMKYFKQAMAEAEYKNDESFWKLLHRRWDSALNQETSRVKTDRLWLFDCDAKGMTDELLTIIHMTCKEDHYTYHYKTKNGEHVICKGFPQTAIAHRPNLVAARMVNAYMLWAY